MQRRTFLAGISLVALGAGAGLWITGSGGTPLMAALAQGTGEADASMVQEMALGSADAPVTVIEYASFTCPHCANFHETVFPQIKANYVDTGKVRFVYREVYFDRFGLWAAMVARCGGEAKYFGIVDLIYERQRDWAAGNDPAQIAGNLRTLGKVAGLGDEALDACLSDGEMAQALVDTWERNRQQDGIDSTPSFLIDGQKYGNMSYEDFAGILEAKLGG
ncbi:MAG: DsbA family protein [Rhodobacteraceae bacterium]|nr:DsbA family protein [Paracoccaceae bacterium]